MLTIEDINKNNPFASFNATDRVKCLCCDSRFNILESVLKSDDGTDDYVMCIKNPICEGSIVDFKII